MLPGEEACAALLAGAAMTYEGLTTAIGTYVNLPPSTSYTTALNTLRATIERLVTAYRSMNEAQKDMARPELIRLISHIWAEAYSTGYSNIIFDDLRDLLNLQARLLIGDIARKVTLDTRNFSDGRVIGKYSWAQIKEYVEKTYPGVRRFDRLPNFVREIFSIRSGQRWGADSHWRSVTIGNDPRDIFDLGI